MGNLHEIFLMTIDPIYFKDQKTTGPTDVSVLEIT